MSRRSTNGPFWWSTWNCRSRIDSKRCWARFFAWVLNREVDAACMPTISSGTAPAAATETTAIATMISTSVKPPSDPALRRSISSKRDTGRQSLDGDGVGLARAGDLEGSRQRGPTGVEVGALAGLRAGRVLAGDR